MFDTDFGINYSGEVDVESFKMINWCPNITRYRPCMLKIDFDVGGFIQRKYFDEYSLRSLKEASESPELEYVFKVQTRTTLRNISQLHSWFYLGFHKDKLQDVIIKTQMIEDPSDISGIEYYLPVTMAHNQNDIIRMFQGIIDARYNIEYSMQCICTCGQCDPEYFPRCVLSLALDDYPF
jgi:hypothetical protein